MSTIEISQVETARANIVENIWGIYHEAGNLISPTTALNISRLVLGSVNLVDPAYDLAHQVIGSRLATPEAQGGPRGFREHKQLTFINSSAVPLLMNKYCWREAGDVLAKAIQEDEIIQQASTIDTNK